MTDASSSAPKIFSRFRRQERPSKDATIFGGKARHTFGRENVIEEEATRKIRSALTGDAEVNPLEADLIGMTRNGFSRKTSSEITMSDRQMDSMREDLKSAARHEAKLRMQAQRSGTPIESLPELPDLHKAQKVTFEGRTVKLHMGTRGTTGKNIIAVPNMVQHSGSTVQMASGVTRMELNLSKDGKQEQQVIPEGLIKNAKGISVQVCFSDQKENLRSRDNQRD